ncbi:hypothetical protein JRO89_XS03G0051600 [Xanthoceras sorbifolium]|uniref:RIN4 pathogenic type III effector avirulence factor Avr cleavage site domain-containing protein n=1 Tax=Xanthoceras sorbifolium TaxID=99658 RepID=A0ABQ8I8R2_9ROSI|nr:hypothetical protein JRO89_XS03G0051600 [Xanthoceras sorbifolium]
MYNFHSIKTFANGLEIVGTEKTVCQNISSDIKLQHSSVPQFGNWDSEGNVPYTAYFEKARNKKSRVKTNINNPEGNPRMLSSDVAPVQAPAFQMDTESGAQKGQETLRTKVRRTSRENADLIRSSVSPLHHNTDRRVATDLPLHSHSSRRSSDIPRKAIQPTVGPDRRTEHSPLHPHHQTRFGGKGNGATWERKGSTEGSNNLAPLTPGRSRLGSVTRGHETPDHSTAVPKFGDWDEANPASADGFSHVFNKVREEKLNNRTGQVPVSATPNSNSNDRMQHDNEMSKVKRKYRFTLTAKMRHALAICQFDVSAFDGLASDVNFHV